MPRNEAAEGLPVGIQSAPGKLRARPDTERIAARVARFVDDAPRDRNVTPLNPGFFLLQRMRAAGVKKRGKLRAKLRDK